MGKMGMNLTAHNYFILASLIISLTTQLVPTNWVVDQLSLSQLIPSITLKYEKMIFIQTMLVNYSFMKHVIVQLLRREAHINIKQCEYGVDQLV